MRSTRIMSPRELPVMESVPEGAVLEGTVTLLWGPARGFGEFLRRSREACNLSRRKAASLIGLSNTYLGLIEQAEHSTQLSFEILNRMAEVYGLDLGDLEHRVGYRSEVSSKIASSLRDQRDHALHALLLHGAYRPAGFSPKHLDLFPRSVQRFLIDLVRNVDASARNGGPTPDEVLASTSEGEEG